MASPQSNQRTLRLALLVALLCSTQAARAAGDSSAPVITHTPVAKSAPGPVKIGARITDESKIFPQVFFRYSAAGAFEPPIDLKKVKGSKDQYEAMVPGRTGLEYYLECYDEYGNGPARAGSPEQPFKVELEAEGSAAAPGTSAPPRPAPWLKGSGSAAGSQESPAAGTSTPEVHKQAPTPAPEPIAAAEPTASPAPRHEPVHPAPPPAVEHHEARETHDEPRDHGVSTTLAQPMTAEGALVRSLLLPGFGQWKDERRIRGLVFGAAAGVSLVATVMLSVRAKQASDTYESAPVSVRPAALDQANSYASSRNLAIGLLVGVWVVNAAEAYFLHGTKDPW